MYDPWHENTHTSTVYAVDICAPTQQNARKRHGSKLPWRTAQTVKKNKNAQLLSRLSKPRILKPLITSERAHSSRRGEHARGQHLRSSSQCKRRWPGIHELRHLKLYRPRERGGVELSIVRIVLWVDVTLLVSLLRRM